MPTFKSTNPMENLDVDAYILDKVQAVQEKRARMYSRLEAEYKHRKNIKRNQRKMERQNRKKGRG